MGTIQVTVFNTRPSEEKQGKKMKTRLKRSEAFIFKLEFTKFTH